MKKTVSVSGALLLALVPAISGCSSSTDGIAAPAAGVTPAGGALPIKASGKALAFRANAKNTASINSYTNLPTSQHAILQARILEKSKAGGIQIAGSADVDKNPSTTQGTNPALVSAFSADTLKNGTAIAGMKDAKGNIYFENGNFGDAQASNETASLSSVGVYNIYDKNSKLVDQIVMKHGTTIRYREGKEGDPTATYAVGYIGNNTTNMPASGMATYKGFMESGTSVYDDNGTMQQMGLRGGKVELTADFGAGKVTGGVSGAQFVTYKGNNMVVLNKNITGLNIKADITGAEYTGTATLVDANKKAIGTTSSNEAIGAFFGDGAAETAAAYLIEGKAPIDGQNRDYIMSGGIGAVKK